MTPANQRLRNRSRKTIPTGSNYVESTFIEKIGEFCLKIARIPDVMLEAILEDMGYNEGIRIEMEKIQREINKNMDNAKEDELKKSKGSF